MPESIHRRAVPEAYVQLLYDYLDERGVSPELALGAPWPVVPSGQPGGVDIQLWQTLLEKARDVLNDPLLPLNLGRTITVQHLGVLGTLLQASENFAMALKHLERYQRLIFDVIPMSSYIDNDTLTLRWDTRDYLVNELVELTGYTVMVQFIRGMIRGVVNPLEIRVSSACPTHLRPYEDYFQCPILFDQQNPGMTFSTAMLFTPLKSPDAELTTILVKHADALLSRLPEQNDYVCNVRRLISAELRKGEPDIKSVSALLECSPRTLQRNLSQAGTTFRHELALVRHEMALTYIADPRLQIVDIALLLGYSEHSAFTRAFREWAGCSPQEKRAEFMAQEQTR